jgi:putative cardiolipin synthase
MAQLRFTLNLFCLLLLTACTTLPEQFEATPSRTWQTPETTSIGAFFDAPASAQEGHSGLLLLPQDRQAFVARFALAAQAERTLDLQYYLWKSDNTGLALVHQVLKAADRGVQVRILMDDIYHTGRDRAYRTLDQHPNVQVRLFNPIGNRGLGRWGNFLGRKSELNHRMHNKIFLVDNAAAILGGRNIGDDYFGIDPKIIFHDLDVLAVGPVAQEAGAAFDLYWNSDRAYPMTVVDPAELPPDALDQWRDDLDAHIGDFIDRLPYAVPLEGEALVNELEVLEERLTWAEAEVIVDPLDRFNGGGEPSVFERLGDQLKGEVRDEVVIQTAYLIPTQEGVDLIAEHIDKGIRYRVMTNSLLSNNHISVHGHYQKYRKPLLEAGVELYELRADTELIEYYRETDQKLADSNAGLHTKAFVLDGRFSIVGSYNMDPRSRIWNSEIGLLVDSEPFAQKVLEVMDRQFEPASAYRVDLDERGKLRWTLDLPEGTQTWNKDPEAPWYKRWAARFIGWLPIEKEL